ncbi:translation initiation factor IF-2 [Enterobacteriaceae endosymbiont of Donacia fulgens]|uniref:translation initiation factor IF-2 n=1 Tax=Enterobacteriaceae endosymbiont of Donacia fulgens TaxID=2675778 RepID=UPI001449288B|nr:translation initiation factor IF-2 [Enterobacteriaceae endosymbiont of Donacia fulgens]QJC38642.1 translation initiation factor IF-2 [Enterobacteriaceae endosymbiont of Donacia fulgens]
MIDAVINIKLLASEMKISIKNIIKYFSDIGISKLENDIVNKEEKKKFLIYLKNKKIKKLKLLNIKKKINNILNNKKKILSQDKKNLLKKTSKINNQILLKKKKLKKNKLFIKNNDKKIYNIDYKKNLELNKKKIFKNKKYYKKKINTDIFHKNLNNKKKYKNNKENKKKFINNKYKKKFSKLYQNFSKPIKNINRNIIINDTISITELSNKMAVKNTELIKIMINMGEKFSNINQKLDQDTAQLIAEEMGHKVILKNENDIEKLLINKEDYINRIPVIRPPIVTIMGHVDHGKTSLLDYILSSNITSKESGGITQYINTYEIKFNNKKITFIDTPGHESFTSMRYRGSQITDIIVLVIAIDDGVMPQTIEAIKHAKKTKVSIIVAINKIDKKISNFEKIKNELSRYNIISEEWGGENIFIKVSAKTGEGINKLLNAILLQAEILELKSFNEGIAKGIVIESYLDKGKGPIASVIIKEGVLKKGDIVLCGYTFGKIKKLINSKGLDILQAGPSTPIKIIGLSEVPYAGDSLIVVKYEKQAKEIALYRKNKYREITLANKQKKLKKVFSNLDNKNIHEINLLVKTDVQGSIEVIKNTLINLSNDKIHIKIIYSGVGEITETDISMAIANSEKHLIIIGFNVKANNTVKNIIKVENIQVIFFTIIYDLIKYMKKYIQKILIPEYKESILGLAKVRSIFTIPKIGIIAGCLVTFGIIKRNNLIKLIRDNKIIYKGIIDSLRRFKESVNEVRNGMECGIGIKNFNDINIGDKIEIFEKIELTKK